MLDCMLQLSSLQVPALGQRLPMEEAVAEAAVQEVQGCCSGHAALEVQLLCGCQPSVERG